MLRFREDAAYYYKNNQLSLCFSWYDRKPDALGDSLRPGLSQWGTEEERIKHYGPPERLSTSACRRATRTRAHGKTSRPAFIWWIAAELWLVWKGSFQPQTQEPLQAFIIKAEQPLLGGRPHEYICANTVKYESMIRLTTALQRLGLEIQKGRLEGREQHTGCQRVT